MSRNFAQGLRWSCVAATGALGLGFIGFASNPSTSAQMVALADPVIRVEEDWQLNLNQPDDNVDSPQLHTVMTPYGDVGSYFAQVLWNYRETPEFTAGGVQLQSYQGESMRSRRSMEYGQLSTRAESIQWTQGLETDGVQLVFEVINGASETWGAFGREMRIADDAFLASLDEYSPNTSARESYVTYGSNRVDSLMITEVRYYGASGLLWTDSSPRVVFSLD